MSSSSKAFVTVNRPLALEIRRMEIVYSSIVIVKEGERRGFFFVFPYSFVQERMSGILASLC